MFHEIVENTSFAAKVLNHEQIETCMAYATLNTQFMGGVIVATHYDTPVVPERIT
jgi:hypothetical protein